MLITRFMNNCNEGGTHVTPLLHVKPQITIELISGPWMPITDLLTIVFSFFFISIFQKVALLNECISDQKGGWCRCTLAPPLPLTTWCPIWSRLTQHLSSAQNILLQHKHIYNFINCTYGGPYWTYFYFQIFFTRLFSQNFMAQDQISL